MQHGPPPQGPQGPYGYYAPQPPPTQQVIVIANQKSGFTAVLLELLPGFFFQWFGWGNIYAGNTGTGLLIMFSYWVLTAINIALCFIVVGFITWPLTWLLFAIASSVMASNACAAANHQGMQNMMRR